MAAAKAPPSVTTSLKERFSPPLMRLNSHEEHVLATGSRTITTKRGGASSSDDDGDDHDDGAGGRRHGEFIEGRHRSASEEE
jgi:hypothetical protein